LRVCIRENVIIKFDTVKVRVCIRVKVIKKFDTVKVGVCIRVKVIIKFDTVKVRVCNRHVYNCFRFVNHLITKSILRKVFIMVGWFYGV
jgi:hypothetical protein